MRTPRKGNIFQENLLETRNREKSVVFIPLTFSFPASVFLQFNLTEAPFGFPEPSTPKQELLYLISPRAETASITHPLQIQSEEAKYLVVKPRNWDLLSSQGPHPGAT